MLNYVIYKHKFYTLIGLTMSGLLYLSHSTALQLSVVKNDSTTVQYVIRDVRLLGINMSREISICVQMI